eukprot:SAG22_NODE_375_length_11547_cov_12.885657_5_plen_319_part_00
MRAAIAAVLLATIRPAHGWTYCVGNRSWYPEFSARQCTHDTPRSLQSALSGAMVGDTVLVMPGTYGLESPGVTMRSITDSDGNEVNTVAVEEAARDIRLSPLGKNMIFRSVGGPKTTTISCGEVDDSYGVIYASGETVDSVLEGFTISGCGRLADSEGGGVRIDGHADANCCQGVTIRNTILLNNKALQGGAISIKSAEVVLDRVLCRNNEAAGHGGAISATVTVPKLTYLSLIDTLLDQNQAGDSGGGIYTYLNRYGCTFSMQNSAVVRNTAYRLGGGLYDRGSRADVVMRRTAVVDNKVTVTLSDEIESHEIFCGE